MAAPVPDLCPECGQPLKKAGMRWSGRRRVQFYACTGNEGCGRTTIYPVHQFQASLISARMRTGQREATANNTNQN